MQKLKIHIVVLAFLGFRVSFAGGSAGTLDIKKFDNLGIEVAACGLDTVKESGKSDSVPATAMPRKVVTVERLAWRPAKDSLGLFPLECGKWALPLSYRGITSVGYMISNESNGFHLRIDNPYRIRTASYPRKLKTSKIRTRSKGFELGYYSHPSLHRNIYLLGNQQWKFQREKQKRNKKSHCQYTLSLGVGYSRTFLNSPTYVWKNNDFKRVPLAGYNYFALQAGATMEYRLKNKATVYLGYNLLGLAPYNWIIMPRKQFQMGVSLPTSYLIGAKHRPK